jgi:hypothetical protein
MLPKVTPPASPRAPANTPRTSVDEVTPAPSRASRVGAGNEGLSSSGLPRSPSSGSAAAPQRQSVDALRAMQRPGTPPTGSIEHAPAAAVAGHIDPGLTIVPLAAFPRAAAEMEAAIQSAKSREVDTGAAASLINDLRRYGSRAHKSSEVNVAGSNSDLMNSITEAHVMQWYQAQGLNERDVQSLRNSALKSGLPNPTGTFATNTVQYIVAPLASAAAGSAWVGAGIGLATAAAAPLLNAFQQSGVVTLCEHIRERGGPSVAADKANINDKNWLPQIAAQVATQVEKFAEASEALDASVADLSAKHGIQSDELAPHVMLERLLPSLNEEEKKTLLKHSNHLGKAEGELHKLQKDLLMTQGAHQRQAVGNTNQMLPRALRAPVAGLIGLTTGTPVGQAITAQVVGRTAKLSPMASAGVQAAAAIFLTAHQHVAAAFDERNKAEYNNKLNLMYADVFTPAGKEKWEKGEELSGDDIDPAKLRKFVSSPAQSLAKRLTTNISARIKGAEAAMENIKTAARQREAGDGEVVAAGDQHEPQLNDLERDELQLLSDFVEKMKAEEAHLKSGEVTKLEPDGIAAGLLSGSMEKFASTFLKEDLIAKYKKPGELSAQTAQRIGQAFHLGAFGSAAAATIGKLGTAALGGASKASTGQILGFAATSAVMGTVGAASQYVAINVKNNRREGGEGIGLTQQVGRGVLAAPLEIQGQVKARSANSDANSALDRMQANLELAAMVREKLKDVELSDIASSV